MATEKKLLGVAGVRQIAAEVQSIMTAHEANADAHGELQSRLSDLAQDAANTALAQAKESGEFDGESGVYLGSEEPTDPDIRVWIDPDDESVDDTIQLTPEFANSIEECVDQSKVYVLPDGYIYAYMRVILGAETVPNFTNRIKEPNAYIREGERYSHSSQAFQTATNDCAIVVPLPSASSYYIRVRGATFDGCEHPGSVYWGTDNQNFLGTSDAGNPDVFERGTSSNGDLYIHLKNPPSGEWAYVVMHVASGVDTSELIVTVNEEITYTTTDGSTEQRWANTGHAFVRADYEDRVIAVEDKLANVELEIDELQAVINGGSVSTNATTAFSAPAYCPVPQLPADGSEGSDFDYHKVTTQDAYDYMDELCSKYTQYITKQTMSKDASGAFDHNRYILSKAYWRAWQNEDYPKMYAWYNGSTVIYSVSVSPRVGDSMYTTPYIGAVYGAVSSVNTAANTASTRTVNGLIFIRDENNDIEPTIVYTKPPQYPNGFVNTSVYDSSVEMKQITRVASVSSGSFVGANNVTYLRYPFEDRKLDYTRPLSIFILSNEHGHYGDAPIPSFAVMRMAKDLCKNTENSFLKWMKENCVITIIPVGNPWGYARYLVSGNTSGYTNSNMVNINRNYDTPGWETSNTDPQGGTKESGAFGAYPGSEIETQNIMNTMRLCRPDVGMSAHSPGFATQFKDVPDNAYFIHQGNGYDSTRVRKIIEAMYSNFGMGGSADVDNSQHYENCGKSPAYIQYTGAVGGLIEIVTQENNTNNEFTAVAMEQAYTQVLLFLQNWCEEALLKKQGGET